MNGDWSEIDYATIIRMCRKIKINIFTILFAAANGAKITHAENPLLRLICLYLTKLNFFYFNIVMFLGPYDFRDRNTSLLHSRMYFSK